MDAGLVVAGGAASVTEGNLMDIMGIVCKLASTNCPVRVCRSKAYVTLAARGEKHGTSKAA